MFASYLSWYRFFSDERFWRKGHLQLPNLLGKKNKLPNSWSFPLCCCLRSRLLQIWNNPMPPFLLFAEPHRSPNHSLIVEFEDSHRCLLLSWFWLFWLFEISFLCTKKYLQHSPYLLQNSAVTLNERGTNKYFFYRQRFHIKYDFLQPSVYLVNFSKGNAAI